MLLDEVRTARAAADAAEARILQVAVEWAHAHPVLDGGEAWQITTATAVPMSEVDGTVEAIDITAPDAEEQVGWCGIPPVAWDPPASFAAATRMTTAAGKALIRDALVLCHRLPRTWAEILAGRVPAWRGRRTAEAVLAAPADVVTYVDTVVAPRAGTIGVLALARVIETAMLHLHAEALEADQTSAFEDHHVRFDDLSHGAQRDGSVELHPAATGRTSTTSTSPSPGSLPHSRPPATTTRSRPDAPAPSACSPTPPKPSHSSTTPPHQYPRNRPWSTSTSAT